MVDGRDILAALRLWQQKIGYVPQEIYLIDDSLSRNIAFGLSDEEIDEKECAWLVGLAQLEEFVASLPLGLDTMVGERGVRLSGGERQRVAIARALYHDPEVVIFDEATSALDNQTERALSRAIEALQGDKTLILIAHRLSTVRQCGRLVFLRTVNRRRRHVRPTVAKQSRVPRYGRAIRSGRDRRRRQYGELDIIRGRRKISAARFGLDLLPHVFYSFLSVRLLSNLECLRESVWVRISGDDHPFERRESGGTGRRTRLRISRAHRGGSSPPSRTVEARRRVALGTD